jgi:prevent-host-death family protein
MSVKIVSVSDLRRRTSAVIEAVHKGGDDVYITQYGRPSVVLVDYERYAQLIAQLEDLSDLASLEAAIAEPARPYEAFLAEMGRTSETATTPSGPGGE